MGWYKDISAILAQEPETWLAYLYGQQLKNIPHLTRRQPRFRGLTLRLIAFGLFLLRHFKLKQPDVLKFRVDYVVFAGTVNQMSSLEGTVDNLKKQGARVIEIGHSKHLTTEARKSRYIPFSYTMPDIIKSVLFLLRRGPGLFKKLKAQHPATIDNYFNSFCSVYAHLVYFHRVLRKTNPTFVITANDHNPSNRSFLAVAHYLGIKSVYLQHASVSPLFPALRVDYAFLDGQSALDTYKACEINQPDTNRNVPIPKVMLTGQKKHLNRKENKKTEVVGVALNALDDPAAAIMTVCELVEAGLTVRVRWHPGQPEKEVQRYAEAFKDIVRVTLSNPKTEAVSDFLVQICWLVAGNSSIHLEAALAGVIPIYYEQSPADSPDYYGYVKSGLAQHVGSPLDIVSLIQDGSEVSHSRVDAIRYYSATYLTEWDGREDELVAAILQGLTAAEFSLDNVLCHEVF